MAKKSTFRIKHEDQKIADRANSIMSQFMKLGQKTGVHYVKGTSRKENKDKFGKEIRRLDGKHSGNLNHEVAKQGASFSDPGTFDNYVSFVRDLSLTVAIMKEGKSFDVAQELGKKHIDAWLQHRIDSEKTFGDYTNASGAVTHIQAIINLGTKREVDFERVQAKNMADANLSLPKDKVEDRAYERPDNIISNLEREDHKLVSAVQLEGGARINEASLIDGKRLGGIVELRGKEMGVINLQPGDAKGGLVRTLHISPTTYQKIQAYVREHGKLHIEGDHQKNIYRDALKAAAEASGQSYTGSHGLRYNYAQARFEEETKKGTDHRDVRLMISREMGHFRPDITDRYLAKG